jgi:hypothetical protein
MTKPVHHRAPAILVLAALTLLAGDTVQVLERAFAFTVVLAAAHVLFAAGLLLLPSALGAELRPLVVASSLCAFVGAMAGAAMQALFRAWSVLDAAGNTTAIEQLQASIPLRLTTMVPGILFPLGLLLLALGLYRARLLGPAGSLILAAGAILFPLGHAVGITSALIGGDVVLVAAFVLLGRSRRTTAAV